MPNFNAFEILLPATAIICVLIRAPAESKMMSKETVCHFDKTAPCVSLDGPDKDACDESRGAFTILPVAAF